MRIVVALGREESPPGEALSFLAREHQLVVSQGEGPAEPGALALALRNHLPDRDVITVLTHVVFGAGVPGGGGAVPAGAAEPGAIAELRSLRALLDAGSVVLCRLARDPVAVDGIGDMRPTAGRVDVGLSSSLLARRLDADLFLLGPDGAGASGREAARRFEVATGRRAATLPLDGQIPVPC